MVYQHPSSSSPFIWRERSSFVKYPLTLNTRPFARWRVPPHPNVSVAASVATLTLSSRTVATMSEPFLIHGSLRPPCEGLGALPGDAGLAIPAARPHCVSEALLEE